MVLDIWKEIPEYEGHYDVSPLGFIRHSYKKNNGYSGRILPVSTTHGGYNRVQLCKGAERKWGSVHRIVAEMFVNNNDRENKTVIHHINNIKTDNRAENLLWCTVKENTQRAWEEGCCTSRKGIQYPSIQGTKHPNSKFTDEDLIQISRLMDIKTPEEIAIIFNVCVTTIMRIPHNPAYMEVITKWKQKKKIK